MEVKETPNILDAYVTLLCLVLLGCRFSKEGKKYWNRAMFCMFMFFFSAIVVVKVDKYFRYGEWIW